MARLTHRKGCNGLGGDRIRPKVAQSPREARVRLAHARAGAPVFMLLFYHIVLDLLMQLKMQ